MMRTLAAALTGALLASAPLPAQIPSNLDFEFPGSSTPVASWSGYGPGYDVARDSVQPHSGRWSLRLTRVGAGEGASFSQVVAPARLAGRRLRVSGYIRTEGVESGYAGLWLAVMSGRNLVAADTMPDRGPRGTTPWTRFEIELPIADSATAVAFGVALRGGGRAWFDGIDLAVLDSVGASALPLALVMAGPAPERPERPEYAKWVREHAHGIASLTSDDFSDLKFLANDLKGRRVVQLGESSHGVGQYGAMKVRLIRYLHEELGYDVVAFESSLFECTTANELPPGIDAKRLMRESIFPTWHTEETLPLFEYVLQTRRTAHPLVLTGFDDQSSPRGTAGPLRRAPFFASLIATVNSAYARRVLTTDSTWTAAGMFEAGPARMHRAEIVGFYDTLATFIDRHAREIARRGRVPSIRVQLASRTARDMAHFVRQLSGVTYDGAMRDSAMAANLDFVLDSLFPGKKVITWGHNGHLAKGGDPRRPTMMGERVAQRRGAEVYTIGFFMYRGTYRDSGSRSTVPVAEMPPGTLEHILAQVDSVPAVFLGVAHQKPEPGNAWVFQPQARTGDVPRDRYDGLLLVRDVTPPHYIR